MSDSLISPQDLYALLDSSAELALVDVRGVGAFSQGHLFWAASLPLTHIETRVAALIPRRSTPIVVCDAMNGLAE
jgi:rhodanese-related sulfurtransferase